MRESEKLWSRREFGVSSALMLLALAACSDDKNSSKSPAAEPGGASDPPEGAGFFDATVVDQIAVTFEQGVYDAMIEAFGSTGDKKWIAAEVTIDGEHYRQAGMRLKGNSSLAGLGGRFPGPGPGSPVPAGGPVPATGPVPAGGPDLPPGLGIASAEEPEALPWLIRLDKYISDQQHQGLVDFVVRSSGTETALNEAVSVALLAAAGLETSRAVQARFTVNDRPPKLRLVLENMNQQWTDENLTTGAYLYKADSSGDYSYRGTDPKNYGDAWSQEAGDDDLTPLIEFLDFINNADDATFAAELATHLDVEAFAEYMAIEDLLQNFDDIAGPGNNSYLFYDYDTKLFTVLAWDHNLALSSAFPVGPGPAPANPGPAPEFPGRSNALVERAQQLREYLAAYDAALVRLRSELFESGTAAEILSSWTDLLLRQAGDLVSTATITAESNSVAAFFVES